MPIPREGVSKTLRVNGIDLHTNVTKGTGEAVPLLVMNGIGARLELLQPFVDHISPERDVIRFDVPGVGQSPLPKLPYRFMTLARTLGAALDELGYTGDIDVLGISWGGAFAQQFARTERRRTRRLVLVSTTPGMVMVPAHPKVLMKMLDAKRYTDPDFLVEAAAELYGGTMRANPEVIRDALHAAGTDHSSLGYYFQILCGLGWTSIPFLPLLKQKTLVLSGSDDPLIRTANAHILGHLIPNAETVIFDGGHLGMVTEADELVPVIERFLDSI